MCVRLCMYVCVCVCICVHTHVSVPKLTTYVKWSYIRQMLKYVGADMSYTTSFCRAYVKINWQCMSRWQWPVISVLMQGSCFKHVSHKTLWQLARLRLDTHGDVQTRTVAIIAKCDQQYVTDSKVFVHCRTHDFCNSPKLAQMHSW